MNKEKRVFDLVDPIVKRPGMYVSPPFVLGVFEVMYHFDYALFMAEEYNKIDRGEEVEFKVSSESMQRLISFICDTMDLSVGKFEIGQALLKNCGGDDDLAMKKFRELYVEFRGEDYCRYMTGGKLGV